MSFVKIAFSFCVFFSFVNYEVRSWTVDLEDIRKHVFEKNSKDEISKEIVNVKNNYDTTTQRTNEIPVHIDEYYDNHVNQKYADSYNYEKSEEDKSYMEKKIHHITSGSRYLEGLRQSLERFSTMLLNCTRMNVTLFQNTTTNSTVRPPMDFPPNIFENSTLLSNLTDLSNLTLGDRMVVCRQASRASERVRQLSKLALKATQDLQDIAYAKKYEEHKDYLPEENELILKLAWFLDRLAFYTGYEPDTHYSDTTTERPNTTVSNPFSVMNTTEDVKMRMMNCLKENSTVPATERCRYPLPLPGILTQMFNITEDSSTSQATSSSSEIRETVVPRPSENLELLIATDARPYFYQYTYNDNIHLSPDRLYNVRSSPLYTKVDLSNYPPFQYVRNVKKRSIDNPLAKIVNYYSKYKVWVNSNSDLEELGDNLSSKTLKDDFRVFEVKNYLPGKSVRKRSIPHNSINKNTNKFMQSSKTNPLHSSIRKQILKMIGFSTKKEKSLQKRSLPNSTTRLPENPTQDLSHYIKSKPGVNYNKNKQQAEKIKEYFKKIRSKTFKRPKRSLKYDAKIFPRISENPFQDVSYYVKNKPGTNMNRNPLQAAQARVALEQIFQTGNIEVIRRYGSNYNPLVPAPFYAGALLSGADI